MLTIRKKLAEQAATGLTGQTGGNGGKLSRKLSFRSQLLTSESNELGDVIPSELSVLWECSVCVCVCVCDYPLLSLSLCLSVETCSVDFPDPDNLTLLSVTIQPG